jgi:hypothetical protein
MMRHLAIGLACAGLVVGVGRTASAQPANDAAEGPGHVTAAAVEGTVTREELDAVIGELARLRAELAALRGELATLKGTSFPGGLAAGAALQAQPPAPSLDILKSQVDELSQTKVESASKMPVRLFGAIVSNTVANSGMANWLENPNITDPEIAGVEPGSFTSTLKQSQIGLNVGAIPMGSWNASGAIVADFFGGVPGFVTGTIFGLPRLLYAFARLEHGDTAVMVGQDHNLLAPRDPTSLAAQSFPLLFRSGNLYLRSPQVRVEQKAGGFAVKGGIAAPMAADAANFYVFAPQAGAGERSGRPAFEARGEYNAGSPDADREFNVGAAVRQAWREPVADVTSTTSFAADFNARLGRIGFAGEYFTTDDAAEFGSGVAQARAAQGGWVEGRLRLTPRLSTNVGYGMDQVDDPVPAAARSENRSVFGNVIFNFTPEVGMSLEYRWLETTLGSALKRTNDHVNAAFVVRF